MKKFLLLILTCAMVFSLCACNSKVVAQGQILYVVAKGVGKNVVTITISGDIDDDIEAQATAPVSSYYVDSNNQKIDADSQDESDNEESDSDIMDNAKYVTETIANLVQSSNESGKFVYTLTAVQAGESSFNIHFYDEDELEYSVNFGITVSDELKITALTINLNEGTSTKKIDIGNDDISSSYSGIYNNSYADITLEGTPDEWQTYQYNTNIIKVMGPNSASSNKSEWSITAIAEGQTTLQLYNKTEGVMVKLSFLSSEKEISQTETDSDGNETTVTKNVFVLSLVSSTSDNSKPVVSDEKIYEESYETITNEVVDESGNTTTKVEEKETVPGFSLPDESEVMSIEKVGEDEEEGSNGLEIELYYRDIQMFYSVNKTTVLSDLLAEMETDDYQYVSKADFTVDGIEIHTFRFEESTIAMWQKGDYVYVLSAVTPDGYDDKTLISDFILDKE